MTTPFEFYSITFFSTDGVRLGSLPWTSLPLYKGMRMTIHGHSIQWEVVRWEFHHGHADENPGLRIVLAERGPASLLDGKPPTGDEPW